jgi:hypothetical protein
VPGYKKFENKKPDKALGAADILVHAVSVLDVAGSIAAEQGDIKTLIKIYMHMLDASDRIMTLAISEQENQEEDFIDDHHNEHGEFGFTPQPSQSEGDIEAHHKSTGLQ